MIEKGCCSSQGLDGEALLFPAAGTNVCVELPGAEVDFSGCDVVVSADIVNQRVAPSPMEMPVAASRWDDGRLTHWQAGQGAHPVQEKLCEWYGLTADQVRVITPDVGGGFGAKALVYPEDQFVPWLARAVGRPVRYTETRSESMNGLGHGRGQMQRLTIGGTRDGKVTAYQLDVVQDAGAFPRLGSFLPFMTRLMLTGTSVRRASGPRPCSPTPCRRSPIAALAGPKLPRRSSERWISSTRAADPLAEVCAVLGPTGAQRLRRIGGGAVVSR